MNNLKWWDWYLAKNNSIWTLLNRSGMEYSLRLSWRYQYQHDFLKINPRRDQVDKSKKCLSTKDIDALSDNRPSFALRPDLHSPTRAVYVPEDLYDKYPLSLSIIHYPLSIIIVHIFICQPEQLTFLMIFMIILITMIITITITFHDHDHHDHHRNPSAKATYICGSFCEEEP